MTVADESYLRPPVWSTVDLRTGERVDVHRGEAPGFDPDAYAVERRTFPSPDGTAGAGGAGTPPRHARSTAPRPA